MVAIALIYASIAHAQAVPKSEEPQGRTYRLDEVAKHDRNAQEKWGKKGSKVYDITDWISGHPGGEVILQAVGGAIDRYWRILIIHNKQVVYGILEGYYIADVDSRDLLNG